MIYLPENLFYNTTAAGILLIINLNKPKKQNNKLILINASREFEKGDPKNFVPDSGVARIAQTFLKWKEEEKFSRVVKNSEVRKNDYNISPNRYINTADATELRDLDEIRQELSDIQNETLKTDKQLAKILEAMC